MERDLTPIATLSHCILMEDAWTHRNKIDYAEKYIHEPLSFTIISKDGKKLWSLRQVSCVGPEPVFLLNGKGNGFSSPIEAARHINATLTEDTTNA